MAETRLDLLKNEKSFQLWEATPRTGRTHQIRVHLAGIGRPILGDFLYGGKSSEVPRIMLHAKSLEFKHPITSEILKVSAELPLDFQKKLDLG